MDVLFRGVEPLCGIQGLNCDDETPAKWQSKASFATHPLTETEWPPQPLTLFSS